VQQILTALIANKGFFTGKKVGQSGKKVGQSGKKVGQSGKKVGQSGKKVGQGYVGLVAI